MDLLWTNLRIPVEEDSLLAATMARKLQVPNQCISEIHFLRRSLDTRKKPYLMFVYTVQFSLNVPSTDLSRV